MEEKGDLMLRKVLVDRRGVVPQPNRLGALTGGRAQPELR
jgi:hypothetical protein